MSSICKEFIEKKIINYERNKITTVQNFMNKTKHLNFTKHRSPSVVYGIPIALISIEYVIFYLKHETMEYFGNETLLVFLIC